jgi:hypothetical protein
LSDLEPLRGLTNKKPLVFDIFYSIIKKKHYRMFSVNLSKCYKNPSQLRGAQPEHGSKVSINHSNINLTGVKTK